MGIVGATKILWQNKKLIIRNTLIVGVIYAALILCVPRYYDCEVTLAPEYDSGTSLGGFASIASTLGINLGSATGSDAISPALYPDLISSKEFLVSLFDVEVTTQDGKVTTDYYTYLERHQQRAWWSAAIRSVKRFFKNIFKPEDGPKGQRSKELNPFRLTEREYMMTEAINSKISCSVDQVNTIISIRVTDQDPLVCATMADSIRAHLQQFITRYRTTKARNDMEYYQSLMDQAKRDYDKAIVAYSTYTDAHKGVIMQSYISQRDELENDMRMKYNIYTALQQQLESAKARVQERTPAFTTLKCASVPFKPAGPKRVIFTLLVMMLTAGASAFYVLKGKSLLKQYHIKNHQPSDDSTTTSAPEGSTKIDNNEA